jgi:hypothetical protein
MTMPGFTGGASLYRSQARYSATRNRVHLGMKTIHPARVCGDCICDVYDFGEPGTCAKLCINKPGDLEYPVLCNPEECNPRCDAYTCGSCTQTCTYTAGGSTFTKPC